MLRPSPSSCLSLGYLKANRRALFSRLNFLHFKPYQGQSGSFWKYCTNICGGVDNKREDEKQESSGKMILQLNLSTNQFPRHTMRLSVGSSTGSSTTSSSDHLLSQCHPFYSNRSQTQQIRFFATTTSTSNKDNNNADTISDKKQVSGKQPISKSAKKAAKKGATKIRELFQKYGWTFVGTYGAIYFTTLLSLFIAVNWGWMDPPSITFGGVGSESILEGVGVPYEDAPRVKEDDENAIAWILKQMESYEWSRPYAEKFQKNPALINLGIAWVAVKFTEPLRLALAVAVTPRIARALGMAPKEDEQDDEDIKKAS